MIQIKNKEQGFSLVELMVVVAIIGVLAAVAIPQLGAYMAKAKQSEAKSSLSAYYMAEKAFYAEYGSYDSRFGAVGFLPEGRMVYTVGMTTAATGMSTSTVVYPNAVTRSEYLSSAYCTAAAACTNVGGTAAAAAASAMTSSTFTAAAIGSISSKSNDEWTINDTKTIVNTLVGY